MANHGESARKLHATGNMREGKVRMEQACL